MSQRRISRTTAPGRLRYRPQRAVAALAAVTVLAAGLWTAAPGAPAQAAPVDGGQTPVDWRTDYATWHRYPGSVTEQAGTTGLSVNPGRIWTDKSVFGSDTEAATAGVEHDLNIADDEMAVSLSALGTTRQVRSTREAAIDLVIVIDNSGSMRFCVGSSTDCNGTNPNNANYYQNSRAYAMVDGVNAAIKHIVAADPNARVSIVSFGQQANTVTPLATPEVVPGTDDYLVFGAPDAQGYMSIESAEGTFRVGYVGTASQGTNIQRGISHGLSVLADQTTSDVAGDVQHIPSVILFSDGEPTYSANESTWWDLSGTATQGPGSGAYYGNGYLAALSAAFGKNRVTDVYNDEAFNSAHGFDPVETNIYTVGLGVSGLTASGQQLAYATLDPQATLPEQGQTGGPNAMANSFATAMGTYAGGGRPTVSVNSGTGNNVPGTFRVNQPSGQISSGSGDVNAFDYNPTYEQLRYNTTFDAPNTAEELVFVFERIADDVLADEPVLPIETTTPDPNTDGYVTFTDPLGPFMRVTEMDSLVFCTLLQAAGDAAECDPEEFTEFSTSTSGNVTTYTFAGSYQANDLFDETALSNVVVTVQTNPSLAVGDIVTWRIPVALLPMLNATILEDPDGTPQSMEWYNSHPVHLYYKVAPKAGVAAALTDPTTLSAADAQALAAYVAANTSDDASVRFYTNAFTTDGGTRTSQATASFRPSTQNDFYRFGQDSVLYTAQDPAATITEAEWAALPGEATVYRALYDYRTVSGQGSAPEKELVYHPTTKDTLLAGQSPGVQIHAVDGVMVGPAGLYNLSQRVHNLDMPKCAPDDVTWVDGSPTCTNPASAANRTETDPEARQTAVAANAAQSVQIRLGNNGWQSYEVTGSFEIGKTVSTAQAGLSPDPSQGFDFTVTLTDPDGGSLSGAYPYRVFDTASGEPVGEPGEISDGGTITLTGGQHARVMGLPDGAGYTVAEEDPPSAYTPAPPDVTSGTVDVPQDLMTPPRLTWQNSYDVEPTTLTTVAATKAMEPSWLPGTYTMQLCPRFGAPAPEGGETGTGCVTADVTAEGQTVDFGDVTFSAPGTFSYGLVELPTGVAGVTDSLAEFRWDVTVTDAGDGTLTTTSTLTQIADDSGATADEQVSPPATYTNTWTAGDLDRSLEIVKRVHDSSIVTEGQTRPPEIGYTFTFNTVDPDNQTPAPPTFPGGESTAEVTSTVGSMSVASPPLTYTIAHVDNTYYYSAVESQGGPIPGMTLSDAVWFFQVEVGSTPVAGEILIDPQVTICETTHAAVAANAPWGDCDPVSATYGGEGEGPVFVNTYAPDPVQAHVTATKTLTGRPWDTTDTFTFDLAAFDAATTDAIEAGDVELPASTTTTATAAAQGSDPNVIFDAIIFHRQGTYRFAVTEQAPSPPMPGLTPDTRTVMYTVTVTDEPVNGTRDGQLEAEVSVENGEGAFVNTFTAEVLFTNASVTKTLTGREAQAGEFSIVVEALDDPSQAKLGWDTASQTFSNTSDAPDGQPAPVTQLPQISFTQADLGEQYTYLVTEQDSGAGGVSYDATEYTVLIAPQYDIDTDELWVSTTVTTDSGDSTSYDSRDGVSPEVGFENTYAAGPGEASIPFEKRIVGRDWRAGDTFAFELTGLDGAPMPAEATVAVTPDSETVVPGIRSGEFGPISFTEPGDYVYEIRELAPTGDPIEDIVYDTERVLTVTVHVTDDGSGTLQTALTGPEQMFENIYRTPYHYDIFKRLVGRDMADGEFSIRVVPMDQASADITEGQVPYPDGATFDMPGAPDGQLSLFQRSAEAVLTPEALDETYCYVYSEELPDPPLPGITYDTTRYQVCTTPTMRDDGMMQATTEISDADTGELLSTVVTNEDDVPMSFPQIVFANSYHSWTLTKSSDPESGSTVQPGSTITYTLTATNTATTTLTGAQAEDDLSEVLPHASLGDLPDGLTLDGSTVTWAIGDLGPGETATISYPVTIAEDAIGVTIRNTVTATGEVPPPEACPAEDPECRVTELHTPAWTLVKTSDPESGSTVLPGDEITYTLTATNASDVADLTGAIAEDDLSDVLPYAGLGDLPDGLTLAGSTLSWAIGDLAPGEQISVSYTVTVGEDASGQRLANVVTGAGDVPPPQVCPEDEPSCRATEHLVPSWTLEKSADPDSGTAVRPGDQVTYTLTATNTGLAPIEGVSATDDLTGVLGAATLGDLPDGLTLGADGSSLAWTIPTLAVGDSATVSYIVTVADDTWGSTLRNAVSGAGPVPPETCTPAAPCSTEHPVPLWTLTKTSDPVSGSEVAPGSAITYTLTVVNDGPAPVDDAVVTDDVSDVLDDAVLIEPLPDDLTVSGMILTWQVPALAVGEQQSVSYTVRIDASATETQLRNVATAGDGGACAGSCTTEHSTTAGVLPPPAPTPPVLVPDEPPALPDAPVPPGTAAPMPPTGASAVLGLALLGLGLVVGGGLLVRRRQ